MIFVTVGTELPFDRLVMAVDQWAGQHPGVEVFAQIGEGASSPRNIQYSPFLSATEFTRRFQEADTIIAHAGMGSILSALRYEKPIIVMPRKASLGEQRNEHQLATARRLLKLGKISVSFDETELAQQLDLLDALVPKEGIGPFASSELITGLQNFIERV